MRDLFQDSQFPGQDLNPEHPEYEAVVLIIRPGRSITTCTYRTSRKIKTKESKKLRRKERNLKTVTV
jgi:hypothetical protein